MSDRTLRSHIKTKGKINQINMATESIDSVNTISNNEQVEIVPQGIPQGLPKENWLEYLITMEKLKKDSESELKRQETELRRQEIDREIELKRQEIETKRQDTELQFLNFKMVKISIYISGHLNCWPNLPGGMLSNGH